MASLGQYQSFALIAYDAISRHGVTLDCCRNNGENVTKSASLLYNAKKMADIVFAYSIGMISSNDITENEILSICNWLENNLFFYSDPIPSLDNTTLNTIPPIQQPIVVLRDFNPLDFNTLDFA
jgi:hypothetical protein